MKALEPPKTGPKILTVDIETSFHKAAVWALWDQNVSLSQLREASQVICWAAKWIGHKGVEFRSDHHDGHERSIARIHDLMDQADILVHYNGRSFDVKHLNREFLLAGLQPPSPYKQVDLLTEVRRNFRFASNKLDYVSQQLGIGEKTKHSGQELWNKCIYDNDKTAWNLMKKYNIQDIKLNEDLYYALLPWLKHPNVGLYSDKPDDQCPTCGDCKLVRRGFALTNAGKYQRFKCRKCGTWSRGNKRVDAVSIHQEVR